jgi:hypothetical protein
VRFLLLYVAMWISSPTAFPLRMCAHILGGSSVVSACELWDCLGFNGRGEVGEKGVLKGFGRGRGLSASSDEKDGDTGKCQHGHAADCHIG